MVNKKILEKLSDPELESYVKPDSRYVPDAIQYAFDILKNRGRIFKDEEITRINEMISKKDLQEKEDYPKNKGWDENATEDENAIELYSDRLIWVFCFLFGTIFGSILQAVNFFKIGKKTLFCITIAFGILYTIFQIYVIGLLSEYFKSTTYMAIFFSGIGATFLFISREKLFPKDLKYRKKSFVLPLIISVLVYIPIIYTIIKGL